MRTRLAPALALLLSGCGMMENEAICTAPWPSVLREEARQKYFSPDTSPALRLASAGVIADNCIYNRARRLASSTEAASSVAKAVAVHCSDALNRVIAARYDADAAAGTNTAYRSPTTGRPVTPEVYTTEHYEREAIAALVEARAGNCKPFE